MEEKLIGFQEAQAVTEFAKALYAYDNFGYWSPQMSNALLQGLNNNPKTPTSDSIRKALASYKDSASDISSYMEFMQVYDIIFSRTIRAYCNVLSFDLIPVCRNAYSRDDYESEEYIADKRKIYDFLDKFNYKDEFSKVVSQIMTHEVYYTWFRKTKWRNRGMKFALQALPQDYCILTGYWEKGMLFDFDMSYFLQPGVDIDGFDPSFQKYYKRVFDGGANLSDYRPTNQLNERKGVYNMWIQTSPEDGAWVFKRDSSNFNTTPLLAPFLKNAIRNDEIEQLQYDKDIASAYAILAGEIRLFDNAKSGTQANQFAISPDVLGGFMKKAKSGLGRLISLAALPVENSKFYQFEDKNSDMYSNQLSTSAGVGSGVSRVIYSSDRQSNAEIEAGLRDMYETMKPLYYQFANFMEFYANKLTKKYKWAFEFDGSNYSFERKERLDRIIKYADKGMVLPPAAWSSVMGMKPQMFERMLQESKWSGWNGLWQLPLNANTSKSPSNDGSDAGRPRVDDAEITDSGEASREMLE